MGTSIWTRAELDEQIALYKEALKKCASGASYSIDSRLLTRQDLPHIREHLAYLAGELAALQGGRGLEKEKRHGSRQRIGEKVDFWKRRSGAER